MNAPDTVTIGIASVGMYLPDPVLTAADIAEQSGLPKWVVREKLGINQKRVAGPEDHPPYQDMLQRLGLTEEQGVYNADYGHIGEQDSIINIIEGVKQGRPKDGDLMMIVGAGVGYVWGAACVRWGACDA